MARIIRRHASRSRPPSLVRAQHGDDASGAFHRDVSRAFFTQRADISKPEIVNPIAESYGVSPSDVQRAIVGMMRPRDLVARL
jgi:predicted DsbA family dithiol-disulfide isomerase